MEGDEQSEILMRIVEDFNPLPPHGGRPPRVPAFFTFFQDFNPLPPHGGRHGFKMKKHLEPLISIHSLRMEGDRKAVCYNYADFISIHSLRLEGDGV